MADNKKKEIKIDGIIPRATPETKAPYKSVTNYKQDNNKGFLDRIEQIVGEYKRLIDRTLEVIAAFAHVVFGLSYIIKTAEDDIRNLEKEAIRNGESEKDLAIKKSNRRRREINELRDTLFLGGSIGKTQALSNLVIDIKQGIEDMLYDYCIDVLENQLPAQLFNSGTKVDIGQYNKSKEEALKRLKEKKKKDDEKNELLRQKIDEIIWGDSPETIEKKKLKNVVEIPSSKPPADNTFGKPISTINAGNNNLNAPKTAEADSLKPITNSSPTHYPSTYNTDNAFGKPISIINAGNNNLNTPQPKPAETIKFNIPIEYEREKDKNYLESLKPENIKKEEEIRNAEQKQKQPLKPSKFQTPSGSTAGINFLVPPGTIDIEAKKANTKESQQIDEAHLESQKQLSEENKELQTKETEALEEQKNQRINTLGQLGEAFTKNTAGIQEAFGTLTGLFKGKDPIVDGLINVAQKNLPKLLDLFQKTNKEINKDVKDSTVIAKLKC